MWTFLPHVNTLFMWVGPSWSTLCSRYIYSMYVLSILIFTWVLQTESVDKLSFKHKLWVFSSCEYPRRYNRMTCINTHLHWTWMDSVDDDVNLLWQCEQSCSMQLTVLVSLFTWVCLRSVKQENLAWPDSYSCQCGYGLSSELICPGLSLNKAWISTSVSTVNKCCLIQSWADLLTFQNSSHCCNHQTSALSWIDLALKYRHGPSQG